MTSRSHMKVHESSTCPRKIPGWVIFRESAYHVNKRACRKKIERRNLVSFCSFLAFTSFIWYEYTIQLSWRDYEFVKVKLFGVSIHSKLLLWFIHIANRSNAVCQIRYLVCKRKEHYSLASQFDSSFSPGCTDQRTIISPLKTRKKLTTDVSDTGRSVF